MNENVKKLKKSEKGTHTKLVTVHRSGKVFKRKQRVGKKDKILIRHGISSQKAFEIVQTIKDFNFNQLHNLYMSLKVMKRGSNLINSSINLSALFCLSSYKFVNINNL